MNQPFVTDLFFFNVVMYITYERPLWPSNIAKHKKQRNGPGTYYSYKLCKEWWWSITQQWILDTLYWINAWLCLEGICQTCLQHLPKSDMDDWTGPEDTAL
ncbi:unnamed protein product [Absidia cylindrospora]